MAGSYTTLNVLDATSTSRTMRVWDESGVGTGPFSFAQILLANNASSSVPILESGVNLAASSAPTINAPTSFRVAVTPTVTASAYTAGNVIGGILTFANILLGSPSSSATKWSAILQSISVKFKATVVIGEIDVAIFTASPSGGTYTDKTAPTFNTADTAKLVGIYALNIPESSLGTMTCYNLDGIGAVIDGASTSLYAVVTVAGTPTPASTSDVIVEIGVLQG